MDTYKTWQDFAFSRLIDLAQSRSTFTSDDLVADQSLWNVANAPARDALGQVIRRGVKEGVIEATNRTIRLTRREAHGKLARVWRSLMYVESPEEVKA